MGGPLTAADGVRAARSTRRIGPIWAHDRLIAAMPDGRGWHDVPPAPTVPAARTCAPGPRGEPTRSGSSATWSTPWAHTYGAATSRRHAPASRDRPRPDATTPDDGVVPGNSDRLTGAPLC